ncbi:hypothetical protein BH24BAC1_BH24BAC1_01300 [soil metagenome]
MSAFPPPASPALPPGIGTRNERSLHASLKKWYAQPGDRLEVPLGGYFIDIVREEQLIEIQTRNFSAIGPKLRRMLHRHRVHLVFPVAQEKWVVQVSPCGQHRLSRRKSPRRGSLLDLFDELVRIPDVVSHPHFSLEVLLIGEEEIRCRDGKGSRRRKGISLQDRVLLDVRQQVCYSRLEDFLAVLPAGLPAPFSNKELAQGLGVQVYRAQKISYCLRKMGLLEVGGKHRNELLFSLTGAAGKG